MVKGKFTPMSNRGQATLEYLTTYGWVILLVIVGLGVISYMGILSPQKMIPERCSFGTQLSCEDYAIEEFSPTVSKLKLRLRNNLLKPVMITSADSLSFEYTLSSCILPVHIDIGERGDVECDIDKGFLIGQRKDMPIQLTFRNNETGPPVPDLHVVKGQLIAGVS